MRWFKRRRRNIRFVDESRVQERIRELLRLEFQEEVGKHLPYVDAVCLLDGLQERRPEHEGVLVEGNDVEGVSALYHLKNQEEVR